MKALEDKILTEGKILQGSVLKVSSFLNHQLDSDFIMELGAEFARLFSDAGVSKILTIESSGIAIALAVGAAMHVPVLFAKKHRTSNILGEPYQTVVHSYVMKNIKNMKIIFNILLKMFFFAIQCDFSYLL